MLLHFSTLITLPLSSSHYSQFFSRVQRSLMDQHLLSHPAPPSTQEPRTCTATVAEANGCGASILGRLSVFLVLAVISTWANYEASKGFDITILNAASSSPAGRRYNLMFVSNGRAARMLLNSSDFIKRILYPDDSIPRKRVDSVTLRMVDNSNDLNGSISVSLSEHNLGHSDYVISLNPGIMAVDDIQTAMASAVHRGMSLVWLRDGHGAAPASLIDGMVQYLSLLSGFQPSNDPTVHFQLEASEACTAEEDLGSAVNYLRLFETRGPEFVARLNQALQERWSSSALERALDSSSTHMCEALKQAI